MKQRILVPVDGSPPSRRALEAAVDLAKSLDASVVLCHVVDPAKAAMMTFGNPAFASGCIDALRDEGEAIVETAKERCGDLAGGLQSFVVQGNPAEEIAQVAQALHAGWIVMGSHGRSGLSRMLMGSVAEGVLRHASVPVMIVPSEREHPSSKQTSKPEPAAASAAQ